MNEREARPPGAGMGIFQREIGADFAERAGRRAIILECQMAGDEKRIVNPIDHREQHVDAGREGEGRRQAPTTLGQAFFRCLHVKFSGCAGGPPAH